MEAPLGRHVYRQNRITRGMVGLYRADEAGFDGMGGLWVTVCEEHGTLANHLRRSTAMDFLAVPWEWCEKCRELVEKREERKLAEYERRRP